MKLAVISSLNRPLRPATRAAEQQSYPPGATVSSVSYGNLLEARTPRCFREIDLPSLSNSAVGPIHRRSLSFKHAAKKEVMGISTRQRFNRKCESFGDRFMSFSLITDIPSRDI
jgi:hypothetical protein